MFSIVSVISAVETVIYDELKNITNFVKAFVIVSFLKYYIMLVARILKRDCLTRLKCAKSGMGQKILMDREFMINFKNISSS